MQQPQNPSISLQLQRDHHAWSAAVQSTPEWAQIEACLGQAGADSSRVQQWKEGFCKMLPARVLAENGDQENGGNGGAELVRRRRALFLFGCISSCLRSPSDTTMLILAQRSAIPGYR